MKVNNKVLFKKWNFVITIFIFIFLIGIQQVRADINIANNTLSQQIDVTATYHPPSGVSSGGWFDSSGLNYYLLSGFGVTNFNISQYTLSSPYDLSSLSYFGLFNKTWSTNQQTEDFYLNPSGTDIYIARTDANAGPQPSFIYHYNMTIPNNISSLTNLSDFFTTSSYYQITGVYISPNKELMIVSGNSASLHYWDVYNLTNPNNLSTASLYLRFTEGFTSNQWEGRGINYLNNGLTLFTMGSHSNVTQYTLSSPYNFATANITGNYVFTTISDYSRGVNVFGYLGDSYYVTPQTSTLGGTNYIKKYLLGNTPVLIASSNGTDFISNIVSPLNGWFPDSSTLDTRTKWTFVFASMLIVSVILLIIGRNKDGSLHSAMPYIVALVDVALFVYFVAIGYISIGIVIMLVLILIAIGYFKFKGGGNPS